MKHKQTFRRYAALTVAALLLGVVFAERSRLVVTAGAQSGPGGSSGSSQKVKVGADLRRKVKDAPSSRVKVIVQPAGAWTPSLDSDLSGKGASVRAARRNFSARSVEMSASEVENLANRDDVAYVSLDREVKKLGHLALTTGADAARASGGSTPYDGAGIGIAVLDSGIDPNHVALKNDGLTASRIAASLDFTGEGRTDDPYGHGTHVAAIAAGNGKVALGAYRGIAPGARLLNLRVLGAGGKGTTSSLLDALDWVLTNRATHNIRVVNLSLGTAAVDSYKNDPLCLAVRRLSDAGVVVVAAAGNEGKDALGRPVYGQIHAPGNDPSVITVGAANTFGTDSRADDAVTTYSSRGPTRSYWTDASGLKHYDNLVKPDLVAPGNKIISASAVANALVAANPLLDADVSNNTAREQMTLNGTSMATPVVAGAAALLLQANPSLTPNLVKAILMYTAQPLVSHDNFEQGAGLVNVEGAMRLARLVRADLTPSTPVGSPLLTSPAPSAQTSISGHTFYWAQGLIMDHTFVTGLNLITQYQGIYGLGVLLSDGTVEAGGVMMGDGIMMGDGVMLSDSILTSAGITISEGTVLLEATKLMGDGVMLSDGIMMGDGVLIGDGVMLSDGVMIGDIASQAGAALISGDAGGAMAVVRETLPNAPLSPAVSAVSTSQLKLTWRDASGNEDGFHVERCAGSTCTNFSQVATVAANSTAYTNSGLLRNTTYRYRVRSFNGAGPSAYTAAVSKATLK